MLGRGYSVQFNGVAVTAQQDLFEINAAAAKPVWIMGLHLSQTTEVGDAMEEGLMILVKSGQTTSGTGGTAPTAIPRVLGDTAFGGTVEVNNTTKATAGTIVTHEVWCWNVRVPLDKIWIPEMFILVPGGGRLTVELGTTPADSITMCGTLWMAEIG